MLILTFALGAFRSGWFWFFVCAVTYLIVKIAGWAHDPSSAPIEALLIGVLFAAVTMVASYFIGLKTRNVFDRWRAKPTDHLLEK